MIGYVLNFTIPRSGEVGRPGFLAKKENLPFDKVFGTVVAERIIDVIMLLLGAATFFMYSQIKYMRFSYEEANLMPKDHEVNIQYGKFLNLFGEEGNVIVIGVKDSTFFTPQKFNNWNKLAKTINDFKLGSLKTSINKSIDLPSAKKPTYKKIFESSPISNFVLK